MTKKSFILKLIIIGIIFKLSGFLPIETILTEEIVFGLSLEEYKEKLIIALQKENFKVDLEIIDCFFKEYNYILNILKNNVKNEEEMLESIKKCYKGFVNENWKDGLKMYISGTNVLIIISSPHGSMILGAIIGAGVVLNFTCPGFQDMIHNICLGILVIFRIFG